MKTVHSIEVPLFKAEIIFIHHKGFAATNTELLKRYPDGFIAYEYGKQIHLQYEKGTTGRVFVASDRKQQDVTFWFWAKEPEGQGDADMGWLAHESYHLAVEILRNAGVKESADSEEVYAYLIEYIMHKLVGIIWTYEQEKANIKQ